MSIMGKQRSTLGDHHERPWLAHVPQLLAIGLILLTGLMLLPAAQAAKAGADAVGYVARIVGTVKIDGVKAKRGSAFNAGANITTGANSYALLKFIDKQRVFLKANSALAVKKYVYDEKTASNDVSSLSLLEGGLRTVSGLIAKHNREAVRYDTPTVTMGVRGTEFMLSIVKGQLFIHVLSGAISFIPPIAGMDTLEAGDYLALSDLGDIIATGNRAMEAAKKAGAFRQMNSIDMNSDAADSGFQPTGARFNQAGNPQALSADRLEQIQSDNTNTEILNSAEPGKGRGDFTLIGPGTN